MRALHSRLRSAMAGRQRSKEPGRDCCVAPKRPLQEGNKVGMGFPVSGLGELPGGGSRWWPRDQALSRGTPGICPVCGRSGER